MGKKKDLQAFSLDTFHSENKLSGIPLSVSAVVMEDGDYAILDLSKGLGNTLYRVPKAAIKVGPVEAEVTALNGEVLIVRHVTVDRKASTIQITKGPAEVFLDPIERARFDRIIEVTTLRASISFRANGEGTLQYAGRTVNCLGQKGERYPKDLSVQGSIGIDKFERKFSNEYQVWMQWAILIIGLKGIYIHEGPDNIRDNGGSDSAGCIHLSEGNAKPFYDWVTGRTRITIDYPW